MNYRMAGIVSEETIIPAKTKVIELDMKDIVSRIQINVELEMDGTVLGDNLAAVLSNIELVDGSEVLFSMSGKECQALDYYQTSVMPYMAITDMDNNDAIITFNINFGRWLYDPVLAFDPTKFNNPQLKITHNYQACGGTPSAARMEVRAYMFDEKEVSPSGFLLSKEHYQFTSGVNNTYHDIEMPTDHPTRRYMIIGQANGYHVNDVVREIRLSEDNLKRIPYESTVWQLLKYLRSEFPRIQEYGHFLFSDTAKAIYASPTSNVVFKATGETPGNACAQATTPARMPLSIDAVVAEVGAAEISGYDPHWSIVVPLGQKDIIDDWYDVTKVGSLKLRTRAGSAGILGTVEIVTEQFRAY